MPPASASSSIESIAGQGEEFVIGIVQRVAGMDQHRHRQLFQDRQCPAPDFVTATRAALGWRWRAVVFGGIAAHPLPRYAAASGACVSPADASCCSTVALLRHRTGCLAPVLDQRELAPSRSLRELRWSERLASPGVRAAGSAASVSPRRALASRRAGLVIVAPCPAARVEQRLPGRRRFSAPRCRIAPSRLQLSSSAVARGVGRLRLGIVLLGLRHHSPRLGRCAHPAARLSVAIVRRNPRSRRLSPATSLSAVQPLRRHLAAGVGRRR